MNKQSLKDKIKENLEELPSRDLVEISDFVEFLLYKNAKKKKGSLEGIWEGKGFEKIQDLDKEVRSLRKEIGISLDKDIF